MKTHAVKIKLRFNAPVEKVFALLNDHPTLGKIYGIKMSRIVDSNDAENLNGVGSVRRFSIGLPIEETVVKSQKNKLIDYTMTKGMHFFSSHYGTMIFQVLNDKQCELDYTITVGVKFPILRSCLKTVQHNSYRG
jgi:hypothetical protein